MQQITIYVLLASVNRIKSWNTSTIFLQTQYNVNNTGENFLMD